MDVRASSVILLPPLVVEGLKDRARLFITSDSATFFSGPPKFAPRNITKINQRVRALNSFLLFGPLGKGNAINYDKCQRFPYIILSSYSNIIELLIFHYAIISY